MKGRTLVAWNLRRLRTERGLTQIELAAEASVDHVYVGDLERETGNPTVDLLDKLAAALDTPIGAFFEVPKKGEKRPRGLKSGRKPRSI
jgi:transcriptional regulator with XRE-family HTH domain